MPGTIFFYHQVTNVMNQTLESQLDALSTVQSVIPVTCRMEISFQGDNRRVYSWNITLIR